MCPCGSGRKQKTQEQAVQLPVWILGVALRTVSVDTDSIAELQYGGMEASTGLAL